MRRVLAGLPLLVTAGLLLAPAVSVLAQDRGSGDYVIFDEYEPEDQPSDAPAPGVSPSPTPAPTLTPPPPPAPPPAPAPPPPPRIAAYEDPALNAVTRRELTPFSGERAFQRFLERYEDIRLERGSRWLSRLDVLQPSHMAFQDAAAEQAEECPEGTECEEDAQIVLTASRISRSPSITNNQTAGVDEGDIVKQIGDYLLVLQDGRIFAVNLRTMRRTDWIEAYRRDADGDEIGADWYDEMLVQDDHILVTAYSYQDDATELSVFKLDQASGRLSRVGVFLISSDDYYSADNYATRIVGDRLVMYAPYELDSLEDGEDRPVIRRWMGPGEREDAQADGQALLDARQIYWPVVPTGDPYLHTISICPLGEIERRDLACRTTGFVGPYRREMFVSPDAVYLWNSTFGEGQPWEQDNCTPEKGPTPRAAARDVAPAVVYRLPIDGGEPSLLPVRGMVFDQFGMDEYRGRFRALAAWSSERCGLRDGEGYQVALVDVRLNAFSTTYYPASERAFDAVPAPGSQNIENRFVDDWLVYGGRSSWGSSPPEKEGATDSAQTIAVPLRNPQAAQILEPGHSHIRIERVGNNAMLNGYADQQGLHVTMLELGETARISGHIRLDGRYESEGRSHAFNAIVNPDGSGILGLPTVPSSGDADRRWWRSRVSELSFMALDASGGLTNLGVLDGAESEAQKLAREELDYECEVSCVDWYGNTRPIFTDGRIFGLLETRIVEARVEEGVIRETGRVDLIQPWPGPGRRLPGQEDDED